MNILERTIKCLPVRGPVPSRLEVELEPLLCAAPSAVHDLSEANLKLLVGESLPPRAEWSPDDEPIYRAALRRMYVDPILEWRQRVRVPRTGIVVAYLCRADEQPQLPPSHKLGPEKAIAGFKTDPQNFSSVEVSDHFTLHTYAATSSASSTSVRSSVFTTVDSRAAAFSHIFGSATECSVTAAQPKDKVKSYSKENEDLEASSPNQDSLASSEIHNVPSSPSSPPSATCPASLVADKTSTGCISCHSCTSSPFTVTLDRVEFDNLRARTELAESTITVLQASIVFMARKMELLKAEAQKHKSAPRVQLPPASTLLSQCRLKRHREDSEELADDSQRPSKASKRQRLSPSSRILPPLEPSMKSTNRHHVTYDSTAYGSCDTPPPPSAVTENLHGVCRAMPQIAGQYAHDPQVPSFTESPAPGIDFVRDDHSYFQQQSATPLRQPSTQGHPNESPGSSAYYESPSASHLNESPSSSVHHLLPSASLQHGSARSSAHYQSPSMYSYHESASPGAHSQSPSANPHHASASPSTHYEEPSSPSANNCHNSQSASPYHMVPSPSPRCESPSESLHDQSPGSTPEYQSQYPNPYGQPYSRPPRITPDVHTPPPCPYCVGFHPEEFWSPSYRPRSVSPYYQPQSLSPEPHTPRARPPYQSPTDSPV